MRKYFAFLIALFVIFTFTVARAEILPDYLSNLPVTGGNYWFVGAAMPHSSDSNPADASTHSYEFPFDTIDTAINAATAQSTTSGSEHPGDVIVILPGHTETVDAATDLVPDKAGLYFYGCGEGDGRPTISIGTGTTVTLALTGADCTFENIIFKGTHNDANQVTSTELIDVGADDITFKRCKIYASDDGVGDLVQLDGDNTADNCKFIDCEIIGIASTVNGISCEDTQSGLTIQNCKITGAYTGAAVYGDEAMTSSDIRWNYVENTVADAYAFELTHTSNTGVFAHNLVYTDDRATALDVDDMRRYDNWFSMGIDLPAVPLEALGSNYGIDTVIAYAQSGSTTTVVDEALCAYPNDYFNSGWTATVIQDTGGASAAPQGQSHDITDFASATGTVTFSPAMSAAIGAGDVVLLKFNSDAVQPANYILVDPNFNDGSDATVASHEIATVTGTVRLWMIVECTKTCTDAADKARFDLGTASDANAILSNVGAAGKASETITAGYFLVDGSPGENYAVASSSAVLDFTIYNGEDVGYTLSGEALTAGIIRFHMWWKPISDGASVTAGALGSL